MKSTLTQIEDIKRDGYSIDFSATFNYAFENYKKIALYSGLIILVFSIVAFIAVIGLATAFFGVQSFTKEFIENLDSQKLTYFQQIISTFSIAFVGAIFAPMGAGFLKMADCADKDEEFNVSTLFTYYKAPYFAQLFTVAFILAVISTGISYVLESFEIMFLGGAISLFISFFTYFAIPLIVFGNLTALDAIKSSVIVVSKNPLIIFALFIVGFLCSLLGFFACCIGIIFTVVFNSSLTYATYFSIFNEEEQADSIDSIGKSDLE